MKKYRREISRGRVYFKPKSKLKIQNVIDNTFPNVENNKHQHQQLTDAQGLEKAYNAPNKIFVDNNKMYIWLDHNQHHLAH